MGSGSTTSICKPVIRVFQIENTGLLCTLRNNAMGIQLAEHWNNMPACLRVLKEYPNGGVLTCVKINCQGFTRIFKWWMLKYHFQASRSFCNLGNITELTVWMHERLKIKSVRAPSSARCVLSFLNCETLFNLAFDGRSVRISIIVMPRFLRFSRVRPFEHSES
jgi:hypothetical protein